MCVCVCVCVCVCMSVYMTLCVYTHVSVIVLCMFVECAWLCGFFPPPACSLSPSLVHQLVLGTVQCPGTDGTRDYLSPLLVLAFLLFFTKQIIQAMPHISSSSSATDSTTSKRIVIILTCPPLLGCGVSSVLIAYITPVQSVEHVTVSTFVVVIDWVTVNTSLLQQLSSKGIDTQNFVKYNRLNLSSRCKTLCIAVGLPQ